jgi:hypothetical protein
MNNTAKAKMLDKIELQLTPKQWAIRLADEMRKYTSSVDFLKAIGKGSYRQMPFIAPVHALVNKAAACQPGDVRKQAKLSRELRKEFQALKSLIVDVNTVMMRETVAYKVKVQLQASQFRGLLLESILLHIGVPEVVSTSSVSEARLRHASELQDWADNSTKLLMGITAHKLTVQKIQEKYFEKHPILYNDLEREIEAIIGMHREVIADFNEFRKSMVGLSCRESDQERRKAGAANAAASEPENAVRIDIEAAAKCNDVLVDSIVEKWESNARFNSNADILREIGDHEEFIFQRLKKIAQQ